LIKGTKLQSRAFLFPDLSFGKITIEIVTAQEHGHSKELPILIRQKALRGESKKRFEYETRLESFER
jgi:hypothetical protein